VISLHPALVRALVSFARRSPNNARLAQANPHTFVQLALKASGLNYTSLLPSDINHAVIAATSWGDRWLQPTQ
jgi:hypothetical protein